MYCDDSGSNAPYDGNYYVISDVIIHESSYDFMNDKINEYKELNFIGRHKDVEIHTHDIWQGKNEFENIDFITKTRLLGRLYQLVNYLPVSLIAVGVNNLFFFMNILIGLRSTHHGHFSQNVLIAIL
jgi:hypothetical protein